ncbi:MULTISPECIES: phosphotransferase [Calothrix]|uniref:Aminoglycoside phosphotransferase family protein n=2 Tax=Calothrix TaxID=1186 RepID=A0ABR8A6K3_9CYAN|nr:MULTISPECIES: phosphotransferase [Calothrix]MBD2195617.1 aminoglycoside phosphotransferase family protein [Calothrix parietina FACHB-288]MBD2224058.1 aminoglycoside phosphotransferase family protein [Calothrix anomala FACHB-343]
MVLTLSSQNVIQYLQDAGLCSSEDGTANESELPDGSKNFNLLVNRVGNSKLLVKQERQQNPAETPHEFFNEWLFHQLLQQFPVIGNISAIASLVVHFDEDNSILVRNYLSDYQELGDFYHKSDIFPQEIAQAIGTTLAALHRATFNRREYRDFMATAPQGQFRYHFYNPAQGIESITPEIFGRIPSAALKFYTLCQRYESLESAIADLAYEWNPCCLTHNDLNLTNILVHSRWQQLDNCLVRLIDWEACSWGDPAFDLGSIIASYLQIWLSSLVVDSSLTLEESLHLAVIPLEILQPSILALIRSYLDAFPMILEYRRDFILRVVQFAGLALIHQIQDKIKCRKDFDDSDIYVLQVAKNLLTMPEKGVLTVFGISAAEILPPVVKVEKVTQPEREKQLVRLYYEKTRLRGC